MRRQVVNVRMLAGRQVPYIAWSEDGFFGLPVALVLLMGKYVAELFGRKAGVELPQSWPFTRLGYHHAGAWPGNGCGCCPVITSTSPASRVVLGGHDPQ